MQIPKEKTLFHDKKEGITLWITLVNEETGLFDILISDKEFNATYRVAEYDSKKYTILNTRVFGGIYYQMVKDNPKIITDIKSHIASYQPENNSLNAMRSRLSDRFGKWQHKQKTAITSLWKKKNTN
jgi:hypothetical protein